MQSGSAESDQFLVVGAGSIGSRHARNLHAMGVNVVGICDPDMSAAQRLAESVDSTAYTSLTDALVAHDPSAGLVCSPPVYHVDQAIQLLNSGASVFIEKPVSHAQAEIPRLADAAKAANRIVQIGYNLRFHPGLKIVKEIVDGNLLGRVQWARFEVGQYLPDWRPGRDYRQTYTARPELGGGILLDASHEIDYACWLLGEPTNVSCMIDHSVELDMDAEDSATLLIRFSNGARADIHVDCLQRIYARQCKLVGSNGTLLWDYSTNEVRTWQVDDPEWRSRTYKFEANDMYVAEMRHFVSCVNEGKQPAVNLDDGWRAVRIAECARDAANVSVRLE